MNVDKNVQQHKADYFISIV